MAIFRIDNLNIDAHILRTQKGYLLRLLENQNQPEKDKQLVIGLIFMLDEMTDAIDGEQSIPSKTKAMRITL